INNAGTLQLQGVSVTGEALTIGTTGATLQNVTGTNTWSGGVTLSATGTFQTDSTSQLTLSGVLSSTGGFIKAGTGTLALTNNNTYTGATTVSAGIFDAQSNTAFGTTAGGVTVANGATAQLDTAVVGAEALTLNGTGAAGTGGALWSASGTSSWAGT